ncbi:membrane protein [Candidatus Francisella endociliophora]|uniref:Outer-membrane lipoprotein LolB n=1 Tax=Candidatus Francisella endociliophora TaxID=653937 RepID=A0A097EQ99_9GAMM|nr:lipoprotein insertase outer membrane protein LolB [Francisella sp. FSC1006]AIT09721.1 membrane protein [Francisella sp. FSC1006]
MHSTMSKLKIGIKQKLKLAIVYIFTVFLVSCATTDSEISPISEKATYQQDQVQQQLTKLKKWQAKGVIGIIYNNKADSANYIYSQNGNDFSIKLYGPLGIGSVEIYGDLNSVTLENSKGQKAQAKDAKALMLEQLGWYVPVEGLKYWIKAISVPSIEKSIQLNKNNLVDNLTQDGWNIKYKGYELVDDKYPLPSKIRMSRDNLILKIVIKSWQV